MRVYSCQPFRKYFNTSCASPWKIWLLSDLDERIEKWNFRTFDIFHEVPGRNIQLMYSKMSIYTFPFTELNQILDHWILDLITFFNILREGHTPINFEFIPNYIITSGVLFKNNLCVSWQKYKVCYL